MEFVSRLPHKNGEKNFIKKKKTYCFFQKKLNMLKIKLKNLLKNNRLIFKWLMCKYLILCTVAKSEFLFERQVKLKYTYFNIFFRIFRNFFY